MPRFSFKFFLLLPFFLVSLSSHRPPAPTGVRPKNVILLIGDGMGVTQVTAGMYSNNNFLHLEAFPITGLMKTHAAKQLVTDSAAGATAFACGCKTYNGAIGVCNDKKASPTLLEQAEALGLATGMVATSSITHATPASFIAHVKDRGMKEEIAAYFLETDIDLFVGGGMANFNNRKTDQRNLVAELIAKGYNVSDFRDSPLPNSNPLTTMPFAWFAADEEPGKVSEGRTYLPDATFMAANFLKKRSEKGFFLMVEGSQIDWGGHAQNAEYTIKEMIDFDNAIGRALEFARADGETLLIVTADHETGGMAIVQGSEMGNLEVQFVTNSHTATMVPVFAFGPGAELFGGIIDNTDIYTKIKNLLEL